MSELINNFIKNPVEYSALVIAFCVAGFTAYQTYAERKHNKISVKPFLRVGYERTLRGEEASYKITLTNGGLGPAFINEFTVLRNNKPCKFNKEIDSLIGSRLIERYITVMRKNSAIAPNTDIELLSVKYSIKSDQDVRSFMTKMHTFAFVVKYSSAYDDELTVDSREDEKNSFV